MMQQGHWCLSFYPNLEGMASNKIVQSEHQIVTYIIHLQQDSPLKRQQLSELSGLRVAAQMVQVRYGKTRSDSSNKCGDTYCWLVKNRFGLHINYT